MSCPLLPFRFQRTHRHANHPDLARQSGRHGLVGRGAGSCLGNGSSGDTFRRPVRRFLPATSISLRRRGLWTGRWPSPAPREPGKTPRTPRDARPPACVPHRHIRRPVGVKTAGSARQARRFSRVAGGRPVSARPFGMTSHVFPPPEAPSPPRCHA